MLILASGSPRRRQLLSDAGFDFTVEVRPTDETWPPHLPADEVARHLAEQKARAWNKEELTDGRIILTADTTVLLNDTILNKPADAADARRMLEALSGNSHRVITGVALYSSAGIDSFDDTTWVDFRALSTQEIDNYIATGKPFDKAGAYGIQDGLGMVGITGIRGDYYNVMGLPVAKLYPHLVQRGVVPRFS